MGILADTGFNVDMKGLGSSMMSMGVVLCIVVFVAILLGIGGWLLFNYMKYNNKIVLFQRVGDHIVPTKVYKGAIIRISLAGDSWMRLKPSGKIIPRPQHQVAPKTYWIFERADGEWIDFDIEDIDMKMRKAMVHYVHDDVRFARVGIERNLSERYKKLNFWEKYGQILMNVLFLIVVTVCLIVLFNSMKEAWGQVTIMAEAVSKNADSINGLCSRIGALGDSGTVPATVPMLIPLIPFRRKKK